MHFALLAVVALLVLGLSVGGGPPSPIKSRTRLKTGVASSKILSFHLVDGSVQESPAEIALTIEKKTGKSYALPVIALATMIASETSSGPRAAKIAVAWAAKNKAKKEGISLTQLLAPRGQFGAQGISGRTYAATAKPPEVVDLDIAAQVYSGSISDTTKGSLYFDSPAAFAKLIETEGYGKTAAEIAATRKAAGLTEFHLPGVNPKYLRMWRYA